MTHMHARTYARQPARTHARQPASPHAHTPARPHACKPARQHTRTHVRTKIYECLTHNRGEGEGEEGKINEKRRESERNNRQPKEG